MKIFQIIYQTLLRLTSFHSYLFHFTNFSVVLLRSGFTKVLKKFVITIIDQFILFIVSSRLRLNDRVVSMDSMVPSSLGIVIILAIIRARKTWERDNGDKIDLPRAELLDIVSPILVVDRVTKFIVQIKRRFLFSPDPILSYTFIRLVYYTGLIHAPRRNYFFRYLE